MKLFTVTYSPEIDPEVKLTAFIIGYNKPIEFLAEDLEEAVGESILVTGFDPKADHYDENYANIHFHGNELIWYEH